MPEWLFVVILWLIPLLAAMTFVILAVWFIQELRLGYYRVEAVVQREKEEFS